MSPREASISTRAATILGRFPRHLDLTRADKVFARMVDALARELDVKTMQTGRVRASHRLGQAEELRDLLLLAGLHDLRPIRFEIAQTRHDRLAAAAARIRECGDDAAKTAEAVASLRPQLPESELTGDAADLDALLAALLDRSSFPARLATLRRQIRELIRIHRAGNATVRALLEASAAYLHLQVAQIKHGGYHHTALCTDLLALPPQGDAPAADNLDQLVLEENPWKGKAIESEPFLHGDGKDFLYKCVDPAPVTIIITGIATRTCFPMVVDTGKGHGLYYAGLVGDGQTLEFTANGQVLLDGVAVDHLAFAFTGAVFAGSDQGAATEFAFCNEEGGAPHGQAGVFVTTTPLANGFAASLPHPGGPVAPITFTMGATSLRFFVRIGHFGVRRGQPPTDEAAVASYSAGISDASLFAANSAGAGPAEPVLKAGFSWREREAFKIRLWLPPRFAAYDTAQDSSTLAKRLCLLLDRHRAAGVSLDVCYADAPQAPATPPTDTSPGTPGLP